MSLQGNAMSVQELRGKLTGVNAIYADAYEIAVRNGFEGTVEEWLESLKGKSSRIYVGSGEMPEGYAVQIDPTGGDPLKGFIKSINGATPDENGNVNINISDQAQPDWNAEEGEPGHVLNRTHYECKPFEDMHFDSTNTEDMETFDASLIGLGVCYKVSDYLMTEEDLENSVVRYTTSKGAEIECDLTKNSVDENLAMYTAMVFGTPVVGVGVVYNTENEYGIEIPSVGTYVFPYTDIPITISYVGLKAIPLEEKFIPKSIARVSEIEKLITRLDELTHGILIRRDGAAIEPHEYENLCFIKDVNLTTNAIGDYAFRGCSNLWSVSNHVDLIDIGVEAFAECERLQRLQTDIVHHVEPGAFKNCKSLGFVYMSGVDFIGVNAFSGCAALETFHLSANLSSGCTICSKAFSGCTSLKELHLYGRFCSLENADAFEGTPIASGEGKIVIHDDSTYNYQHANVWSNFADVIVSPADIT